MQVEEVRQIAQKILSDSLKNKMPCLVFDKIVFSKSQNSYTIMLRCSELYPVEQYILLNRKLGKLYQNVRAIIQQQDALNDLLEDESTFSQYIKKLVVLKNPCYLPLIQYAHITLEDPLIHMEFDNALAPDLFETVHLREYLENHFVKTFDHKLTLKTLSYNSELLEERTGDVVVQLPEECKWEAPRHQETAAQTPADGEQVPPPEDLPWQDQPPADVPQGAMPSPTVAAEKPAKKMEKPAFNGGAKGGGTRRRGASPGAVWNGKIGKDPVNLIDLQEEGTGVCVMGTVLDVEVREVKDGKFSIFKFDITDFTSTITCKIFSSAKNAVQTLEQLKKGKSFKIVGNYEYDTYARDMLMNVTSMESVTLQEREDACEQKRVELHLHTTMSAQDGLSSAKDLIARAAKWGHKAIAITDHGVVQAFPEASTAGKKNGIKILYGMEAYMVDDTSKIYQGSKDYPLQDTFIVFDIETTGLSPSSCELTEIGAVKVEGGKIVEEFQTFVNPQCPIPPKIVSLTGITDDMVKDAPKTQEALQMFGAFAGEYPLVAHNAGFDVTFMKAKSSKCQMPFAHDVLDTLKLSRALLKNLKNYKLNTLAAHFRLPLNHHRAVDDARCTGQILIKLFEQLEGMGIHSLYEMNESDKVGISFKNLPVYHTILLCKNKQGLTNLYKLVSFAHLQYYYRKPRVPKSLIDQYREGLLVGSACEQGELFRAVLEGKGEAQLKRLVDFYDYLEIQPHGNNEFLVRNGTVDSIEGLYDLNRKIIALGRKYGKKTVATCDTHFLDPHDEYYRRIVMHTLGFSDADQQAPLYLHTTDEMLEEFSYLGEDVAREVVIHNPNEIADMIEEIELFPGETAMPEIPNASQMLEDLAYQTAKERYGDPLPELIQKRLERELGSIIKHGFSVLYWIAHELVKKSLDDGYLVGSRGSVGSSLAATMTGITEVNPLPPHYLCPNCKHSDFDVDLDQYGCGVDLPDAVCPICGTPYKKDGYNIPFEVFLGIDADKVPDIDLNFSGEYQPNAHKFTVELFGKDYVYRAGTISAIQEKTAFGFVKKYAEDKNIHMNNAEMTRLAKGISGTKRTTGQHPGGLVIVPKNREVFEFTPIQHPADDVNSDTITTHFDFNSMHDILIKLDILGHDNPTSIRMLEDTIEGLDALKIPLDDPETMALFCNTKSLGVTPEQLRGCQVGTLGIPEFGTFFVRQMLVDTMPTTMAELIRISGLSHGTDVWVGNAQDLIRDGVATLSQTICTRDDIMNYLVRCGVEQRLAFFTMESVRKGKGLTEEMEQAMHDANVPQWFIDSCKKIKYMFPKAHAVAYVVMAFRIAYCKVHHKEAFYATYFSIKADEFDASYVLDGQEGILKNLENLEAKGPAATANEKNMITLLELANEMYQRGVRFLPVDLKKSKAKRFTVEDGNIRLPFVSVPKLGEKAAIKMEEEREKGEFISIEDLKNRTKISSAVIEAMEQMGTLVGLGASNQISLFDV